MSGMVCLVPVIFSRKNESAGLSVGQRMLLDSLKIVSGILFFLLTDTIL